MGGNKVDDDELLSNNVSIGDYFKNHPDEKPKSWREWSWLPWNWKLPKWLGGGNGQSCAGGDCGGFMGGAVLVLIVVGILLIIKGAKK